MTGDALVDQWSERSLSDIVESAVDGPFGSNLKTEHYVDEPGVRVVRLQNIGNGEFSDSDRAWVSARHAQCLSRHGVQARDIVVASLGDDKHPVGRACLYPETAPPGIVKADCFRLRLDESIAVPGFVMRALCCPATRIGLSGLSQGVTRDRVNLGNLLRFKVQLAPLAEQRRIAEILDTLDEAIRKTEQVIAKLRQMKQGLLHDLLTRGIDDNGELRDPERHPEQFKDSPLGRIPREWEVGPLLSRVTLPSGQLDPRVEPFRSWVLVAPDHIESGTGRLLDRRTAASQGAISGKYGFSPADVVYSKIRPYLRKAVLVDFAGLCSADMYPLHPSPALNPRFLLALILGEDFSRFAEGVSMRSGFPKINRDELSEYAAAFPPRREQDAISQVLLELDHRQSSEEAALAKLRTLKQGLMDDLLTGRVRVPVPEEAEA